MKIVPSDIDQLMGNGRLVVGGLFSRRTLDDPLRWTGEAKNRSEQPRKAMKYYEI